MADVTLRLLKRQTLAAPADLAAKDRYIAALERTSGLGGIKSTGTVEEDLVAAHVQQCLEDIRLFDENWREKNKGKTNSHFNTDLMYSIGGISLASIAESAANITTETIKAFAKQRGFDLQALNGEGIDPLLKEIKDQIIWNITGFNDPNHGTVHGMITHIMEEFCWTCGNHRGYQNGCDVCYPEYAVKEVEGNNG